jgi:hypothetical protein
MPNIDQSELKRSVNAIVNRWPAVGLAVGVVRDAGLEFFFGHGVAHIESAIPVTEDTVFRMASITKTFTAIAVMQLEEQGLIDMDAPANDYLRGFRLVPAKAGWRPATTRHLLTHTAGVPEWVHPSRMINSGWFGESFPLGERLPTLAEYYRGGLRLAAEPGTIWTYTDHGVAAPLLPRAHLRAPRDDRYRFVAIATAYVPAGHWLPPAFQRGKGCDRPSVGYCGGQLDLLHPEGHGALRRRAPRGWFR